MNNQQAYNDWSAIYDTNENKTRDLEAIALRASLPASRSLDILEIGCGTGKNTDYLLMFAKRLVGADFSPEMLGRAMAKIKSDVVEFRLMDLREEWKFGDDEFDLVTCSLVLEHIEDLDFVFREAARVLRKNGRFYIGELHPFKQYQGSRARFENGAGEIVLECFTHHVSDFFEAARKNNFACLDLKEWFDKDDKNIVPRLLTMIFRK